MESVPQHAAFGAPSAEEEKWADDWLREFFRDPRLEPPTPRQRYVLVPRFRYAAIETSIYALRFGGEPVPDPDAAWEALLVKQWHEGWREQWLATPHLPEDDEDSFQV